MSNQSSFPTQQQQHATDATTRLERVADSKKRSSNQQVNNNSINSSMACSFVDETVKVHNKIQKKKKQSPLLCNIKQSRLRKPLQNDKLLQNYFEFDKQAACTSDLTVYKILNHSDLQPIVTGGSNVTTSCTHDVCTNACSTASSSTSSGGDDASSCTIVVVASEKMHVMDTSSSTKHQIGSSSGSSTVVNNGQQFKSKAMLSQQQQQVNTHHQPTSTTSIYSTNNNNSPRRDHVNNNCTMHPQEYQQSNIYQFNHLNNTVDSTNYSSNESNNNGTEMDISQINSLIYLIQCFNQSSPTAPSSLNVLNDGHNSDISNNNLSNTTSDAGVNNGRNNSSSTINSSPSNNSVSNNSANNSGSDDSSFFSSISPFF